MSILLLWLSLVAHAQEAEPPEEPVEVPQVEVPEEPDEGVFEIIVWGEAAIRQARYDVVREMADLGYRAVDKPGGEVVFRPPEAWMGRVRLTGEGRLEFLRPVVAFKQASLADRASIEENPNLQREPEGVLLDGGVQAVPVEVGVWVLPSWRILKPIHARVTQHVADEVEAYRDVIQATALHEELDALPDRLDALWSGGVPLVGEGRLESMEARKAAVLDFWATRAPTEEGDRVSRAVEAWLVAVVQESDHPITQQEEALAEARRVDGRKLEL